MSNQERIDKEHLFRICSFLVSSANGLFEEPRLYGPIRLLQAFSMVASLPENMKELKRDDFLLEVKNEIDNEILAIATAKTKEERTERAKKFVRRLSVKLAKELGARKSKRSTE